MLKKVNEGTVESDEGFMIKIDNPDYLKYFEGDKFIEVSIDFNENTKEIFINASKEITNWCGRGAELSINVEKKINIQENIRNSLALLKGNFIVL